MPRFIVPNSASLHTARHLLRSNRPFSADPGDAVLELHPKWVHLEPVALAMIAAWGAWCRRRGLPITVENLGPQAAYAARMKLFAHLGVNYDAGITEHEEAGRFLPLTQVQAPSAVPPVIADISALLHLQDDPESLSAVQYCVSELLRNVLEHSASSDGAFVCAHRYRKRRDHSGNKGSKGVIRRVTIAVADCGRGIPDHLAQVYSEASLNDRVAIGLAMRPGVTGARPGPYGTPDNAGAGLFITRGMAKGTGGYFFLLSGTAAYRLRRASNDDEMTSLCVDPYDELKHDSWQFEHGWPGTVVSVEIRTDKIADYGGFFRWIFERIPRRKSHAERIRFT